MNARSKKVARVGPISKNQRGQVLQSRTRPNMALNRSAVIMRLCLFSFPVRARLALRYVA